MTQKTSTVVLLTLFIFASIALAATAQPCGICLHRDPSPPQVILNDGTGAITFDWAVTYDTNCQAPGLSLEAVPPSGSPFTLVVPGCSGLSDAGLNEKVGSFTWNVPAGTPIGNWYGKLRFHSDWAVFPPVSAMMEDEATVGFLIAGGGRFQICKFNDWDGDGKWDKKFDGDAVDEPGLPNWQFRIERPIGTLIATVTTGANGFTEDIILPMVPFDASATSYWISEIIPSGCWERTTPASNPYRLDLPQGLLALPVQFGNWQPGRVQFAKFEDKNGNGVQDSGELPLAGWKFSVRTCSDSVELANGVTDATGKTPVMIVPMDPPGVSPTTYCVHEESPAGDEGCWARTTPSPGPVTQDFTVVVPISCSGSITSVTVGNWQASTFRFLKYNDLNGNCILDAGEQPLAGWRFSLTKPGGGTDSLTTGSNGYTPSYTGPAGRYTVEELPPVGDTGCWVPTCGENPFAIDVATCEEDRIFSVGNREPRFRICKFKDSDGNGTRSDDEPWLNGWSFDVTRPDGTKITLVTDANGCTPIVAGPAGSYTIQEANQAGWVQTTQNGRNPFTADDSDCTVQDILVGNQQSITITGQVLLDVAPWPWMETHWVGPDSRQQNDPAWEPDPLSDPPVIIGVQSAQMELWANGQCVRTTATAADGSFAFTDVQYRPDYTIKESKLPESPCDPDLTNAYTTDWPGEFISKVAMCPATQDFGTPSDLDITLAEPTQAGQEYGGNFFYLWRPCRVWGVVHPPTDQTLPPAVAIEAEKLCSSGPDCSDPEWLPWVATPINSDPTSGFYIVPCTDAECQGIRQGCPAVKCGYRLTVPSEGNDQSWTAVVTCNGAHGAEKTVNNADGSFSVEFDVDPGADVRVDFYLDSEYRKQCNLPVTLTQQDWHNLADQSTIGIPGGIVYNRFATAFKNFDFYGSPSNGSLIVGGKHTISFTPTTGGMKTLVAFFPQMGPYSKPTRDYVNSATTPAGELAGEVVALMLNVAYNDMRLMPRTPGYNLEDFIISTGLFKNRKVGYALDISNKILGGDPPIWYGIPDYATLIEILKSINANYQMSDINSFHDRGYLIPNFWEVPRGSHPAPHTPHVP